MRTTALSVKSSARPSGEAVGTIRVSVANRSRWSFLLTRITQQVERHSLLRESLALCAALAGFLAWGSLLALLAA